jgi:hypothetical protein
MANYKTIREYYTESKNQQKERKPNYSIQLQTRLQSKQEYLKKTQELKLIYEEKEHESTSAPDVFGPAFWFTLHNGASKYPVEASPIQAEKMKGFIKGIPIMLPCEKCSSHAQTYIESKDDEFDDIVSGREKLFVFFWEFHNYVNRRYNKPEPTLEEVKMMFMGKAKVTSLRY